MVESKNEKFEEQTKKYMHDAREFLELPIKDTMKRRVWDLPLIERDTEILDVIAILSTNDHIWVVNNLKEKRILGIITEHDILHALRPIKRHRFFGMPTRQGMGLSLFETADHIMTHDPITCTPNQKVKEILHIMEAQNIRRMPVVKPNTDEIISEVTVHQLIKRYYEVTKPLCELCEPLKSKVKSVNDNDKKNVTNNEK